MLEGRLEIEATYDSVAQAVRDAAYGESTLLACRGSLALDQAVTLAEQHVHALQLADEVRITVGHGRVHVQPTDTPARRRLPSVPGGLDRRSVFDRRVGERRKLVAETELVHGERRSGTDRRSGNDRRRPVRVGVPR